MPSNNRKTEILNIALDEFTRKGYAGARLQAIADQTGVTKAMIHYYFKNKDTLFREAYALVCQQLIVDLLAPLEGRYSLFSKIDVFIDEAIERFNDHPKQAHFLVSELNRHPEITQEVFRDYLNGNLDALNEQMEEAAENYEIAPVTADQLIANILSLVIFPSAGRPFLKEMLPQEETEFDDFMQKRNESIKDTIMNWLAG